MSRPCLALEFAAIFVALPSLYIPFRHMVHPIPVLWCVAAFSAYLLKHGGYFTRNRFWGKTPSGRQVLFVLGRFVALAVIIGLFTLLYEPGRFLDFPKTRPALWLVIILLYPLFSVVPQGIVYRAFIFNRYEELFGKGWAMIAASGIGFCYAHIFFLNPIAVVFSLVGGILFAHTYLRSASLWFSAVEHALYGDFIFTIGLGHYLYSGALR
jgi:membrane protease YdiL (CAAX protease family)